MLILWGIMEVNMKKLFSICLAMFVLSACAGIGVKTEKEYRCGDYRVAHVTDGINVIDSKGEVTRMNFMGTVRSSDEIRYTYASTFYTYVSVHKDGTQTPLFFAYGSSQACE